MAKKRRKLNKDFEKIIYASKKNVELVLAKIYDIDDEDIQKEYINAFNQVVYFYDELKGDYEQQGFNDNSEELLKNYKNAFNLFESPLYGITGISIRSPFFRLSLFSSNFFIQSDTLLSFLQILLIW